MFTSATHRAASAYKRVAVETSVQGADPHTLVGLLFDALLQSIAEARGAMVRGDTAVKGAALGKAVRILEEGLKAGLNLREGGEIAANLSSLYTFCIDLLCDAIEERAIEPLHTVVQIVGTLRDAWNQAVC